MFNGEDNELQAVVYVAYHLINGDSCILTIYIEPYFNIMLIQSVLGYKDFCHRGCAQSETVLQTIQIPGVCNAVYGIVY